MSQSKGGDDTLRTTHWRPFSGWERLGIKHVDVLPPTSWVERLNTPDSTSPFRVPDRESPVLVPNSLSHTWIPSLGGHTLSTYESPGVIGVGKEDGVTWSGSGSIHRRDTRRGNTYWEYLANRVVTLCLRPSVPFQPPSLTGRQERFVDHFHLKLSRTIPTPDGESLPLDTQPKTSYLSSTR